ncbi:MAG: helix-turn-helix domain-containing protein [Sphingomonadales bacterium]|nr:helix-turn-helix domain-containing protein [Sphingomonadales bacterium]MDE2567347.1 helix-turn-helix domain-containing protein [Sphingomonadales bacterium]
MTRLRTVPTYALYGEADAAEGPGFAHIETIAARSALHDWEIAPHRHAGFVQVLVVERGEVRATVAAQAERLGAPCFVIVPSGEIHGFRFEPETRGHVLTLGADFAAANARLAADPLSRALTEGRLGRLQGEDAARVAWLAGQMLGLRPEWDRRDHMLVHTLSEALVRLLLRGDGEGVAAADVRVARLRALVERHFREHRPVDFYARELGMTRRTLSRLTAAHLGCTPTGLLHRRLATEARRLLHYSNASAAQVAAELGFDDPSYFSRFHLRVTGRRPREERAAFAP